MFKEFGSMMSLLGNRAKLQQEMEKFQQQTAQIVADGVAGGNMVTVRANGKLEILSVMVSDQALQLGDKELLGDLITAAANQALVKVREQVAAETAKLAENMGLPAGMLAGIPGLNNS
jgi:hypothetical protein